MAGDENALVEWGVSDEDITIREKVIICDEADETIARSKIENYESKKGESKIEAEFLLQK